MSEQIELLPCPTGHPDTYIAETEDHDGRTMYYGRCGYLVCGWITEEYDAPAEAAKIWNRRVSREQPSGEISVEAAFEAWPGSFMDGGTIETAFRAGWEARAYLRDSEPGWISVGERTPAFGDEVYWVHPTTERTAYGTFIEPSDPEDIGWFMCNSTGPYNCKAHEVKWWMSRRKEILPAPPEAKR